MVVGILQPSYLPWLGYFEQIWKSDVFVLYDDVQFEKGSWRNRNRIKTPQGPQWLTVPVLSKGQGPQLINHVAINSQVPWQSKHTKALNQNYGKAPYFAEYSESLFNILNRPCEKLADLNLQVISWLNRVLGIQTKVVLSSQLNITGDQIGRLIAVIKYLGGDIFYEGAAGKNYIDIREFDRSGITVQFQDYVHPVYTQLYGEFVPYLSVIDLIFNHGPESLAIITGSKT